MSLITISSTNPDLSYIISKNPVSGLLINPNRRGHIYGWFPPNNNQQYCLWFRDSETEVSYDLEEDQNFEYLDRTRFNSPMFLANAIAEFFDNAMKIRHEKDASGFEHTLTINLFNCPEKYIEIFQQQFTDFTLETKEIVKNNYVITIKTKRSIYELLNYASIFSIFCSIGIEMPLMIEDSLVAKYLSCMNVIDAPYLVRYVFKVNLLRRRSPRLNTETSNNPKDASFDAYRELLERSGRYAISMTYGSTTNAREAFVRQQIGNDKETPILDVGCGEGHYLTILCPDMKAPYYAVDIDPDCLRSTKRLAERRGYDMVKFFDGLDAALKEITNPTNILLIEVLEHMQLEEATVLLSKLIESGKAKKILITTPNADFNKHFGFEDNESRHEDHKFEFTKEMFQEFIAKCAGSHKFELSFIGDLVDNQSMGFGAVIQ